MCVVCGRDQVYVRYDNSVENVALIVVIIIGIILFIVFVGVLVRASGFYRAACNADAV